MVQDWRKSPSKVDSVQKDVGYGVSNRASGNKGEMDMDMSLRLWLPKPIGFP